MILEDDAGKRFLRIAELTEDGEWIYVDSGWLPDEANIEWTGDGRIDIYISGILTDVAITKNDRFGWSVSQISEFESGVIQLGYEYVMYDYQGRWFGNHLWSGSVEGKEFRQSLMKFDAILESADRTGWMNVTDPSGEAVLWDAPSEDAEEVGTIFENIPVKVLEEGSEWSLVRLGDQIQGYLRNAQLTGNGYLDEKGWSELYVDPLTRTRKGIPLYAEPKEEAEMRGTVTLITDLLAGKHSGGWYIVLTQQGMSGYVEMAQVELAGDDGD